MKHIFIIGSKGIPAKYGGFETFVDELVSRRKSPNLKYYVYCLSNQNNEFIYKEAFCFNVKVPNIGPAKAVYYDLKALKHSIQYIKENNLTDSIVYILACRIGPFFGKYVKVLHKLNCKVFVNPDGHEWKRAKWNYFIKRYWKLSEKLMVKHADLLICDSKNIEFYIKNDYKKYNPRTSFIAYGADTSKSTLPNDDSSLLEWYKKYDIHPKDYYLVVGRFVPENNYETMIREFMKSSTQKNFVIITNIEKNKFFNELKDKTHFEIDNRIKFVGTVYNQQLLKKIRENAFAYLHGHEVGGTNPSLLEALASTQLNLLLDVGFNREVAEEGALYWSKVEGSLCKLINSLDNIDDEMLKSYELLAKKRVNDEYSWDLIEERYENLWNEFD